MSSGPAKPGKKEERPGGRRWPALVAGMGVASLLVGGCALLLATHARLEQERDLKRGIELQSRMLEQGRLLGAKYVSTREQARRRIRERLAARADALAANALARIQSAISDRELLLAKREAVLASLRAIRSEEEKRRLAARREQEREELAQLKQSVLRLLARRENNAGNDAGGHAGNDAGVTSGGRRETTAPPGTAEMLQHMEVISPPELVELETGTIGKRATNDREQERRAHRDTAGSSPTGTGERDIPIVDEGSDWPQRLIVSCRRDLANLLQPGCTLSLQDATGREYLHLAADNERKPAMSVTSRRRFDFGTGRAGNEWRLLATACDDRAPPPPSPTEYAELLARHLGLEHDHRLRGVVYDTRGTPLAVFPAVAPGVESLPLPRSLRAWEPLAGSGDVARLTRVDTLPPLPPCTWRIGMQLTVADHGIVTSARELLTRDSRWGLLLGLGACAGFLLLAWLLLAPAPRPRRRARDGQSRKLELVRNHDAPGVMEETGLLLAEITPPGQGTGGSRVKVTPVRRQGKPGSLKRLQALHRGPVDTGGCRILDHARSPLLRELVAKVRARERPPAPAAGNPAAQTVNAVGGGGGNRGPLPAGADGNRRARGRAATGEAIRHV